MTFRTCRSFAALTRYACACFGAAIFLFSSVLSSPAQVIAYDTTFFSIEPSPPPPNDFLYAFIWVSTDYTVVPWYHQGDWLYVDSYYGSFGGTIDFFDKSLKLFSSTGFSLNWTCNPDQAFFQDCGTPDAWETITIPATTAYIAFIVTNPGTGGFVSLDDTLGSIEFQPVANFTTPLPTTLPLFATGFGALGLLGWRSRRRMAIGRPPHL